MDPVHAAAEAGEQPDPGRVLQHAPVLLLADPGEPAGPPAYGGEEHQDVLVGDAVEQADRRQQPPGLPGQVGEGVGDARRQRGQPARAGVVPGRQRGGAPQPGQQVCRVGGVEAGQGQPHASG